MVVAKRVSTIDVYRSHVPPTSFEDGNGTMNSRFLGPYPKKVRYDGKGDTTVESSYSCEL